MEAIDSRIASKMAGVRGLLKEKQDFLAALIEMVPEVLKLKAHLARIEKITGLLVASHLKFGKIDTDDQLP